MKLTEILSPGVTREYLLEAFGGMRFSFQVYDGKIEHVNDWEIYGWCKGKTIEEVVEWTKAKEDEQKAEAVKWANWKKEALPSLMQQRLLLWQEEDKKRKAWEAERWTNMEKGDGYFSISH